jgi:lipopolysaccharide transport protein LptA
MKIRDYRSIIIILTYAALNTFIFFVGIRGRPDPQELINAVKTNAPEYTEVMKLEYFHLKNSIPQMSLSAESMRSQEDFFADFSGPRGVYNYQTKNKTIKYSADSGIYEKRNEKLILEGEVKLNSVEANYSANHLDYFFKKDLIVGAGKVNFEGEDPKTKDQININSESMRAHPQAQVSFFQGNVNGVLKRKKKYEGRIIFASHELQLDGQKSMAHLEGDVKIKREMYDITAGKADMYLENFNKNLKYFVLNDDVKVKEKVQTKDGMIERNAYAERLEGFTKEQKMVLSGAPKVEMGKDVIKGYRITIRENVDLVEVDDAMSDMEVKRKKK